jgi:hypothetical protein
MYFIVIWYNLTQCFHDYTLIYERFPYDSKISNNNVFRNSRKNELILLKRAGNDNKFQTIIIHVTTTHYNRRKNVMILISNTNGRRCTVWVRLVNRCVIPAPALSKSLIVIKQYYVLYFVQFCTTPKPPRNSILFYGCCGNVTRATGSTIFQKFELKTVQYYVLYFE